MPGCRRAEVQHAQLAPAVGEVERDARDRRRGRRRARRGASASRGRWPGPGGRRTRRDTRAPRLGTARAARARDPWGRRTPRAAVARARPARGRASPCKRFETAKRMSADLLALRLPPACSRASRRRHMASARRSIAVVTRGASASPFTRARYRPPATTRPRGSPGTAGPVSTLDPMRIAIGGDHAGYPLKQHLVAVLEKWGHDVDDLGTDSTEAGRLPAVSARPSPARSCGATPSVGIVLGGSGQGEQISANKVHGARAALCNDLYTARMAAPAQRRQRAVDRRAGSSRPSWPRRSRGSSSTPRSKAAATSAGSTRSPRSKREEASQ